MKTDEQAEKSRAISGIIAFWCFVGVGIIGLIAIIVAR